MNAYTPGPWVATESHSCPGFWYVDSARDGSTVVMLAGNVNPNTKADAHAIAAMPALMEVVQALLRAPISGSAGPGAVTIELQEFHLRAAREAVARAAGAAP